MSSAMSVEEIKEELSQLEEKIEALRVTSTHRMVTALSIKLRTKISSTEHFLRHRSRCYRYPSNS